MSVVRASFEICYKVYQKGTYLLPTIKKYFEEHTLKNDDQKLVKKLSISFYRHQLAIFNKVQSIFGTLRTNDQYILGVALTAYSYVKEISSDEIMTDLDSLFKSNKSLVNYDLVERTFTTNRQEYKNLVPENLSKDSVKYLSLTYNIPEWTISMWNKHYGKAVATKLIEHTNKVPTYTMRVNSLKTTLNYIIENGERHYSHGPSIGGTNVFFKPDKDMPSSSFVEDGRLIPLADGLNHLVNKLHVKYDDILVIDYANIDLAFAIAEHTKCSGHIGVYKSDDDERINAKVEAKKYDFKHMEFAGGPLQILETYVSNSKDMVVVLPKSTNFNAIRETPDFFMHLNQNELDDIIVNEMETLEEGSRYVLDGGYLVYAVETCNNKEGSLLVKSFLGFHSDFKLMEERQMLEIDRRNTDCYYAILRKVGK